MTAPTWPQIVADVAAAAKGALSSCPRLSRAALVRWARAEARKGTGVARLTHRAAAEIDALVDQAIADASR